MQTQEYKLTWRQVTVVAQALGITAQTTSDVYKLDDGSGEIEARHWVESRSSDDMDAEMDDSLSVSPINIPYPHSNSIFSGYIRVTGTIRTYQGRRHINATIVRPITDNMEAFFHFNEVMAVTMFHNRGPVRLFII